MEKKAVSMRTRRLRLRRYGDDVEQGKNKFGRRLGQRRCGEDGGDNNGRR